MPYDPYAKAIPAPALEVELLDVGPDGVLPASAWAEPGRSPALRWGALPDGARSVLITAFDADAPIPGGLWHWIVQDVPATAQGLEIGAGAGDDSLPGPGRHGTNSLGGSSYAGVNPPPGTGTHRLFVSVTALSVDRLEVPADASPALVHVLAIGHTLARGVAVATSDAPAGG